jgi:hypothetical protein
MVMSEFTVSRATGKPAMFFAIPMERLPGANVPAGVILAGVGFEWFARLSDGASGSSDQVVQVLDSRDGAILAEAPATAGRMGQRFPHSPMIEAFRAFPGGGSLRAPDLDGVGRVFGGQVIAQALQAAQRSTEAPKIAHSLHAYFMRPGDEDFPIIYRVVRDFEGKSFATRRAIAIQRGKPILNMAASFQAPEEGLTHQDAMPDVPPPEELRSEREMRGEVGGAGRAWSRLLGRRSGRRDSQARTGLTRGSARSRATARSMKARTLAGARRPSGLTTWTGIAAASGSSRTRRRRPSATDGAT